MNEYEVANIFLPQSTMDDDDDKMKWIKFREVDLMDDLDSDRGKGTKGQITVALHQNRDYSTTEG